MRAVRLYGAGGLRLCDEPEPVPGPGGIVILAGTPRDDRTSRVSEAGARA